MKYDHRIRENIRSYSFILKLTQPIAQGLTRAYSIIPFLEMIEL